MNKWVYGGSKDKEKIGSFSYLAYQNDEQGQDKRISAEENIFFKS